MSPKRYSNEEARTIMARLRGYSFEDLGPLFKEGKAPFFQEIEGDTAGSLLASNPKTSWWMKLLTGIAYCTMSKVERVETASTLATLRVR